MNCTVPNCERKAKGRGYCAMHWKRWRTHGDPLKLWCRHGHAKRGRQTRTWRCWRSMIDRCYGSGTGSRLYRRKGVIVCRRWRRFENFLADMGEALSERHQIDRIHNGGVYGPGLCRWATPKEQNRNRKDNVRVSYRGKTLALSEWAERLGIKYWTLWSRIRRRGWPVARAFRRIG